MGAKLSLIRTFIVSPLFSTNTRIHSPDKKILNLFSGLSLKIVKGLRNLCMKDCLSRKIPKGKNLISTSQEKGVKHNFGKYFK
jgi:hypothetical protein